VAARLTGVGRRKEPHEFGRRKDRKKRGPTGEEKKI
jgi:hypothetical protein